MRKSTLTPFLRTSAVYLTLAATPVLALDTGTDASTVTSSSTTAATSPTTVQAAGSAQSSTRLYARYRQFVGSDTDTRSLIQGLRYGEMVTLGGVTAEGRALSFLPPTRPMGWGNIDRALGLAQAKLAAMGITQPSPEQLRLVLNGGTLVSADGTTVKFDGVLSLRSQGMGWGEIAHAIGVSPAAAAGRVPTPAATASSASMTSTGTTVRAESSQAGRVRAVFQPRQAETTGGSGARNGPGIVVTASGAIASHTSTMTNERPGSGNRRSGVRFDTDDNVSASSSATGIGIARDVAAANASAAIGGGIGNGIGGTVGGGIGASNGNHSGNAHGVGVGGQGGFGIGRR